MNTLTRKADAARLLHVSTATLTRWEAQGRIDRAQTRRPGRWYTTASVESLRVDISHVSQAETSSPA